ncbi:MAG: arsenate reductase [Deltaproteobacteria bacterium HGW-Deltaproteobacteria-1]|nr:MAG: arsenate reductase [Deltaproteobacteria bacterium HGW-Deltaproteobacteria-1]
MQKKVEINERDFFKTPFTRAEINALLQKKAASVMFSFRSPSFKSLGLDQAKLKDNDLIDLMLKEPRLIRRPIVKIGGNVYFGADIKALAEIIKT